MRVFSRIYKGTPYELYAPVSVEGKCANYDAALPDLGEEGRGTLAAVGNEISHCVHRYQWNDGKQKGEWAFLYHEQNGIDVSKINERDVTITLPAAQWEVLANLLDLASDEFGNNTCNDYDLPIDGNVDLIKSLYAKEYGYEDDEINDILSNCDDDQSTTVCVADFVVMDVFKKLIEKALEKN